MMTPPTLAPAVASAPGGVEQSPESSAPASSGGDFSQFMQVCKQRSDQSATPDSQGKVSKPVSSVKAQPADAVAADTATATVKTSGKVAGGGTDEVDGTDGKNTAIKTDATAKDGAVDPSVTSTLIAMMLQPLVPPTDIKTAVKTAATASRAFGDEPAACAPAGTETPGATQPTATLAPTPSLTPAPTAPSIAEAVMPHLANEVSAKPVATAPTAPDQKAITAKIQAAQDAAKNTPADISLPQPDAKAPNATIIQQVVADISSTLQKGVAAPIATDGTGVALSKERMKLSAEKNEIAGSTVQKLQGAARGEVVSTDADAPDAVLGLSTNIPDRKKDPFAPTLDLNFSAKTPVANLEQPATVSVTTTVDAASQADRVSQLVSREVLSLRQTGAASLDVSLKVDAHTDISLQLTTRDGQVQAAVRCERGSLAGLDGHWNDLQSSLAKQNITLLPLEATSRSTGSNLSSGGGGSFNFNQSSQQSTRQTREITQDLMSAGAAKPARNPQPKTQKVSGQGWESWA